MDLGLLRLVSNHSPHPTPTSHDLGWGAVISFNYGRETIIDCQIVWYSATANRVSILLIFVAPLWGSRGYNASQIGSVVSECCGRFWVKFPGTFVGDALWTGVDAMRPDGSGTGRHKNRCIPRGNRQILKPGHVAVPYGTVHC